MYLFIDTEATGLPVQNTTGSFTPRLVQLGWLLTDDQGMVLRSFDEIIKPSGFQIPKRTVDIHGISTDQAYQLGIPLSMALKSLSEVLRFTHFIVGHNIDFDYQVIQSEFKRSQIQTLFNRYPRFCTMKSPKIIEYCRVMRGDRKADWPSLSELYFHLFNEHFQAHNAYQDARACAQCFFQLKSMNLL